MWPVFHFHIGNVSHDFHTNTFLFFTSLLFTLIGFTVFAKRFLGWGKAFMTAFTTLAIGFVGARLFHVFFERPEFFRENPHLILSRFDGMTFYGGFLAGGVVLIALIFFLTNNPAHQRRLVNGSAIIVGINYGLLRLGCFANGCCWGKLAFQPWAVTYVDDRSVMPALGLPVHPVQLYDSLGTFLLVLFLMNLYRKAKGFEVAVYFLIFSSALRILTEFFRGDRFRGEAIWLGLSTSQFISVWIIVGTLFWVLAGRLSWERLFSKSPVS